MTLVWIAFMGVLHGLQPDHAAAAAALAARSGTSAWRAALRLAAGHAAAISITLLVLAVIPRIAGLDLERWLDRTAGAALLVLGLALLLQIWRSRYLLHAHAHAHHGHAHEHEHLHAVTNVEVHEHRHAAGAVAVGLVLGLAGARTVAAVLPGIGQGWSVPIVVLAYSGGIAVGVAGLGALVDGSRALIGQRPATKWLDLAAACGALASGVWLIAGQR